jgi:hypothetical protein
VTQQPMSDSTAIILGTVGGLLTIALLTLVIAALASVLSTRALTRGGKLLWALAVLQLPVLGAVAWFVIGRQGPLNSLLGLVRSGRHEALGSGQHVRDDLFGDRPEPVFAGYGPNGANGHSCTLPRNSSRFVVPEQGSNGHQWPNGNGHSEYTTVGAYPGHFSPGSNGDSAVRHYNGRKRVPRSRIPR